MAKLLNSEKFLSGVTLEAIFEVLAIANAILVLYRHNTDLALLSSHTAQHLPLKIGGNVYYTVVFWHA